MSIVEQFAGIEIDNLIAAPLTAAADTSVQLAKSTADFIKKVGCDGEGRTRTVTFGYQKINVNEYGMTSLDNMKVDVPLLAIVPIPNLQVDEINVLFDIEVKQSERKDTSIDMAAGLTGSANIFAPKISISGNVSAHSNNTRSSDNSAKYHVDLKAANHGTPEGLARVLDIMAASVAPELETSEIKNADGQDLSEEEKKKVLQLKQLILEIKKLENGLKAAKESFDVNIFRLNRIVREQKNIYQSKLRMHLKELNFNSDEEYELKVQRLNQSQSIIEQSWNEFEKGAEDMIKIIAESKENAEMQLSKLSILCALDESLNTVKYNEEESYYNALIEAQNEAVRSYLKEKELEDKLLAKKLEYSNQIVQKCINESP